MEIIYKTLEEITPYKNNPRNNEEAVEPVAASIREFGFKVPIVIDKEGVIVTGHTRYSAAKLLEMKKVPCIIADDLTPAKIRAFRLADNKTGELALWDMDALEIELQNLITLDFDMQPFGFEDVEQHAIKQGDNFAESANHQNNDIKDTISTIPPFAILDSKKKGWQKRKTEWKNIITSEKGRKDNLLGDYSTLSYSGYNFAETSIFDPCLCEILYKWVCPAGGTAIDPFSGGSVRGLVASMLGIKYTGIDLRPEQIQANIENYKALEDMRDFTGAKLSMPEWITGDSSQIDTLTTKSDFDFGLTCPPYADLEKYSNDPADISNMEYPDFINTYRAIIRKTVTKLKDNAFFAIVIGDIRDKKGYYRDFIGDTKRAFYDAGCTLYNDCILLDPIGSSALRANAQFSKGRKVVKTHQNVLIFLKGDAMSINNLAPYSMDSGKDEDSY